MRPHTRRNPTDRDLPTALISVTLDPADARLRSLVSDLEKRQAH
jgi:hypothetical protein